MNDVLLMIIPAVFIVIGVVFWRRASYLQENGKKADATIIDSVFERSGDGGSYYPVVRFLTDKQQWVVKQLDVGYNFPKKKGTRVEVVYDPEEPTNVLINSVYVLAIMPRVFVCIGVVGFILGILVYLGIVSTEI
jgi:hypothetical protein